MRGSTPPLTDMGAFISLIMESMASTWHTGH